MCVAANAMKEAVHMALDSNYYQPRLDTKREQSMKLDKELPYSTYRQ